MNAAKTAAAIMENEEYISSFAKLLEHEAASIADAARRLDPDQVRRALELVVGCRGKLVLTGIGKSGFIARKVGATLTSTGTRAVFMHPSDALHGDLGIIDSLDVVIVLRNSGETDEILAMLPYLKHRAVPLIGIVGNPDSTVARTVNVTVTPNQLAYTALQLMENRASQISVLPVIDDKQRVVGLVRLHDLVRSGL